MPSCGPLLGGPGSQGRSSGALVAQQIDGQVAHPYHDGRRTRTVVASRTPRPRPSSPSRQAGAHARGRRGGSHWSLGFAAWTLFLAPYDIDETARRPRVLEAGSSPTRAGPLSRRTPPTPCPPCRFARRICPWTTCPRWPRFWRIRTHRPIPTRSRRERVDFVLRARHTRMRHMSEADEAQAGLVQRPGPRLRPRSLTLQLVDAAAWALSGDACEGVLEGVPAG